MLSRRAHSASILISFLFAFAASAQAQTLAITGATIIDGTGNDPLRNGVVLITDDRITALPVAPIISSMTVPEKETDDEGR